MIDTVSRFITHYPSHMTVSTFASLLLPLIFLAFVANYYVKSWKIIIVVIATSLLSLLISSLAFLFHEKIGLSPDSTSALFILYIPYILNLLNVSVVLNRYINEINDKRYSKKEVVGFLQKFNLYVSIVGVLTGATLYFLLPFSLFTLIAYSLVAPIFLGWINFLLFIKII